MMHLVEAFDRAGDSLADRVRGHAVVDRAMYTLSEAANHSALWHGLNALDALTSGGDHLAMAARRSTIQVTEQALVNGPVKMVFRRRRPDHESHDHPHDIRTPRTSSFPSGHATAAFCSATLLSRDQGHPALWFGLATAVAWSRVHTKVHHPSDVVAGAAIGVGLAALAGALWPSRAR